MASLATTAFTTTLVPALVAREVSPIASAWFGSLLGVIQLPGRVLLMRGSLNGSPSRLLVASFVAQAAGIAVIAVSDSSLVVASGVAAFAVGAGLITVARPHLVHTAFSVEHSGYINGRLASIQNLARAGGPVLALGLASFVGYAATFAALAILIAALAAASHFVIDA